jgi:hypothetical protein
MAKPGLRKVFKYSEEFKATAVALSRMEGVGGIGIRAAPHEGHDG